MRTRIIRLSLVAILALAVVGGWLTVGRKSSGGSTMSLARNFTSVFEMAKNSELVVDVEILSDPESFRYNGVMFSKNQVKVQRVLKGPAGLSELTVLDNGGVYQGEEYGLGGAPLMHEKDHYLLFLYKYKGPITDKESYMITGVWQGKVSVSPGGRLQWVGPSDEQRGLQSELRHARLDTILSQMCGL
jgi:hypothetical protein